MKDLLDAMDKYLKSPGTLSISKLLHDIYKSLNLEGYKEADDSQTGMNRSENGGPNESEPENGNQQIREFIVWRDNKAFEFEPIAKVTLQLSSQKQNKELLWICSRQALSTDQTRVTSFLLSRRKKRLTPILTAYFLDTV